MSEEDKVHVTEEPSQLANAEELLAEVNAEAMDEEALMAEAVRRVREKLGMPAGGSGA
jgi:hypothetical protein